MKRKSLLFIVSVACISMMLAGCTGDVSAVTEPAEEQEVVIAEVEPEAGVAEIAEADAEVETEVAVEAEPEPEPEPEVDPNLELSKKYFAVSEERAREHCGLYVKSGEGLYAVTDQVPEQNYYDTGIGFRYAEDKAGSVAVWADNDHDSYVVHDLDTVFPIYGEGDSAILYVNEKYSPESLTFVPVEEKGYTISAYNYEKDGYVLCVLKDWDDMIGGRLWYTNYEVYDTDGNLVENIRDLDREASYSIKGDGGEVSLTANCRYYEGNGEAIEITGEDQGDNSFLYDLSELPSGTYFVNESFGFVTIE